ncbi:polysaccharide deacetylase family protein [Paenibacillus sp. P26]|nr:polysaccharide deacetylase family protein [Paenibacillus sp. P26]
MSAHTVEHPFLEQSPPERVVMEIMEDRQALEALAGYPVRGMSYPFGTWNAQVAGMLCRRWGSNMRVRSRAPERLICLTIFSSGPRPATISR